MAKGRAKRTSNLSLFFFDKSNLSLAAADQGGHQRDEGAEQTKTREDLEYAKGGSRRPGKHATFSKRIKLNREPFDNEARYILEKD